jgi:cobalt-zinc-cadmium efflux system outer membrane protein
MTRRLLLSAALLLSGCLYPVREKTDQTVCDLAAHPFDPEPASGPSPAPTMPPPGVREDKPTATPSDVHTAALLQADKTEEIKRRLNIPDSVPGAETPAIQFPKDLPAEKRLKLIRDLYPELPPLPMSPAPQPGPGGQPYTLADLQRIAAENSPTLRQAAFDVEAARGNLFQARAYPNPTVGLEIDPSSDATTATLQGLFFDQVIKTAGKLTLQVAGAQKDLDNAELALKRARSDLATQVRNAYFALLVAKETVRVNEGLARFTDEVYRIQEQLLEAGQGAPYEPASLRGQAETARLALKQSVTSYLYAWEQLVAVVGKRQLPLSDVAGRVDVAIPFFDYDTVRAHILRNHTDVLTARNAIDKARYVLKLAQVTPVPDVDVRVALLKEFAVPPEKIVHTVQVGMPFPIWDRNKGGIIAAEAALGRATEEPHRVETALTNSLAVAYIGYKNSLDALEAYRKRILPDQVRVYRGVFERRHIDANVAFADLVQAQQALATSVTNYLTQLGALWTAAVSVADLLQTDDLFQLAEARELPTLPEFETLPPLPCCHPCAGSHGAPSVAPTMLPPPKPEPLAPNSDAAKSED